VVGRVAAEQSRECSDVDAGGKEQRRPGEEAQEIAPRNVVDGHGYRIEARSKQVENPKAAEIADTR
jgi:hypothetical protein